ERRTAAAQNMARQQFRSFLQRLIERQSPGWTLAQLTCTVDLERSFGPAYCRGMLRRGRSGFAVLGVSGQEQPAMIDGALTIGLLWLDHLRTQYAADLAIEGLRLFVPHDGCDVVRARAANLRLGAKLELIAFNEHDHTCTPCDIADTGNMMTKLVRCAD